MSIQSRVAFGFGYGALAVAGFGLLQSDSVASPMILVTGGHAVNVFNRQNQIDLRKRKKEDELVLLALLEVM